MDVLESRGEEKYKNQLLSNLPQQIYVLHLFQPPSKRKDVRFVKNVGSPLPCRESCLKSGNNMRLWMI